MALTVAASSGGIQIYRRESYEEKGFLLRNKENVVCRQTIATFALKLKHNGHTSLKERGTKAGAMLRC